MNDISVRLDLMNKLHKKKFFNPKYVIFRSMLSNISALQNDLSCLINMFFYHRNLSLKMSFY